MLILMLMDEQSEGETLDGKQLREEEWIKGDVDPDADGGWRAGRKVKNRNEKIKEKKS